MESWKVSFGYIDFWVNHRPEEPYREGTSQTFHSFHTLLTIHLQGAPIQFLTN